MRSIKCWHCGKRTRSPKKYGHHYYCQACYNTLTAFRSRLAGRR